ncbi:MAG: hypothetical protein JNK85_12020 [Verrucomicrobiales bacterium]|nr:hypothetical protein [Verrucomicrobiales bacterium]
MVGSTLGILLPRSVPHLAVTGKVLGAATLKALNEATRILDRANHGDPKSAGELLPLVYEELRRLAGARMARELPGQTLQPTALVHEASLHLTGPSQPPWQSRAQFFAAAAEAMRRFLIDRARKLQASAHHCLPPGAGHRVGISCS